MDKAYREVFMKKCIKCQQMKPLNQFGVNRGCKSGFRSQCRECYNSYMNNWYRGASVVLVDENSTKTCTKCFYKKSITEFGANKRGTLSWCKACSAVLKRSTIKSRVVIGLCGDCGSDDTDGYYYCSRCRANRKLYKRAPMAQVKRRDRDNERRRTDIQYRLSRILRKRLYGALHGDTRYASHVRDLGCTMPELIIYIENQFTNGMSWENYGNGTDKWNIDHIIALADVDLTDREQLLKVVHYTNLRPLWQRENCARYALDKKKVAS